MAFDMKPKIRTRLSFLTGEKHGTKRHSSNIWSAAADTNDMLRNYYRVISLNEKGLHSSSPYPIKIKRFQAYFVQPQLMYRTKPSSATDKIDEVGFLGGFFAPMISPLFFPFTPKALQER
jgi:hypothetical protein